MVHCHLTPLCRVTSRTSPCFQLQPPPSHSTVWTGSANQTEALLGKSIQSTEWPPSLLPPSRTLRLAVSVLVAAALADPAPVAASPDELEAHFMLSLFLQKLTLRGCSRLFEVFRMASDPKQLPEAVRGEPMQSSERPPTEKQSIFDSGLRPTAIILDAVGLFRKLQFHLLLFLLTNISPTSPTS